MKKIIAGLLSAGMLLGLLSGCGQAASSSAPADAGSAPASAHGKRRRQHLHQTTGATAGDGHLRQRPALRTQPRRLRHRILTFPCR